MKKVIFKPALNCIGALLIIHLFSCQPINGVTGFKIKPGKNVTPEDQIAIPANMIPILRNEIPVKAVREFITHFADAKNVRWQKANDGEFIADFTKDSIKTMVWYDRRGLWNCTLRKYCESKMPAEVRAMVKSTFFDHAIIEINEIKLAQDRENIIYSILIKNTDNFKILRIYNEEMKITGDYTKP
ncbi:MAG: hypothetical protein ABI863_18565 [Ginsengibacter sp.]